MDARGGLLLQEGTLVGFESVLLSYTHAWPDPDQPVHKQGIVSATVSIGPNVWLGARTFVLPGASGRLDWAGHPVGAVVDLDGVGAGHGRCTEGECVEHGERLHTRDQVGLLKSGASGG